MPDGDSRKLSVYALTALVVGSMVGAGIFSLPRSFAAATGPAGALVAWLVSGSGMYMLARVFQSLAERKPELDSGIHAYAKAGFGDYAGFLSVFGYWLVCVIANTSYWILIKSTLGKYLPVFGDGNTLVAIVTSSIGLWLFHFMVLRGTRQAAMINLVTTIAKIVPIVVFVAVLAAAYRSDLFRQNFWGGPDAASTGLFEQVRATMMVTVFVFIGIEGASVYSRFARKRSDIGLATTSGFLIVLGLMALVTLLPFAVLDRPDIADTRQPSMSGVFAAVVGPWGAIFISVGLLVSVLGAYLAWTLIGAEVVLAAARASDMPKLFRKENDKGTPSAALWLTNLAVQCFIVSTYWSQDAFALMLNLTSSMVLVPYALVAAYGLMVARSGDAYGDDSRARRRDIAVGALATAYTLFLVYAGGLKFVLLSTLLYAPGTVLYLWARRESGRGMLGGLEWVVFGLILACAVAAVVGLARGDMTI